MRKFTFSFLGMMILPLVLLAQEKRASDTTRLKFLPTGVRVATDVLSLVRTKTSDQFSGWEVNADIDFTRYYLTVDYGNWSSTFKLKNGAYGNDGSYLRVGADVNFLLKDPDRNMFFLGLRYGMSKFADQTILHYGDTNFGVIDKFVTNRNVEASWKEITGGLRVKIWNWLWMGYTARFKFGMFTKGEQNLKPYDVPGFGLTIKPNTWGFNYQVFLRIPVRKQK
jgi:Domain of unknown function (DUF6048)